MSFERDYYAILGIAVDADEKAIKRTYRNLARRYHPDVSQEAEALERFREIQEAYQLLLDPEQRRAYDHWRRQQGLDKAPPLALRVTPSQEILPCLAEPQILYLLVEILASEEVQSCRLPINLCLVLDRSTSMKGSRMHKVQEAARYIVDQLEPDDILSVVAFADRAEVVLPGEPGMSRGSARTAITLIECGGGTEILQGLKLGWEQIRRWQGAGNVSHLILLTDGQTYGDEQACLELAQEAAREHVGVTLMGVGSDWNDKLLDQMAELSGSPGGAVYIDTSDKIGKAFQEQVQSLSDIYAQELVLRLHSKDGASLKDAYRIAPRIGRLTFVEDQARLGTLEKGRRQAFVLEMLVASADPGEHRLAQLEVEGVVPAIGHGPVRCGYTLAVTLDAHLKRVPPIPKDIAAAMAKLAVYKMQDRAMVDIEMGQIEPAVARLNHLATRLLEIGESDLARAARLEAGRLEQTGSLSPEGRKKIRFGTRGLGILPGEVGHD